MACSVLWINANPLSFRLMIDQISEKIAQHSKLSVGRILVVGVSGIDGSGKSTFAKSLKQSLIHLGLAAEYLDLDDFLNPRTIRHKNSNQIVGYFEDNFDYASLEERILDPARQSTQIECKLPVLELESDQIVERPFQFVGPGVLIIEGVFLFRKELREKFDFRIWLEVDFEVAMNRVLDRPRDKRYGNMEAIRTRYETRFFPTQRFHLERDQPSRFADMIIDAA